MAELTQKQATDLLNSWRANPLTYLTDILGVEKYWKLQKDLCDIIPTAIKEHKHIYIGSGHSLGKDYICAALSLWFLHSYSPSKVIQTAPTDRQVKKIMWAETMTHWRNKKIDLGGTPYASPYLEIRKEDWFLIGFTTKESGASADGGGKFQGFKSPNIMVLVSEAQAVEDVIYDQIDGITTSENVLVIFIGNPTRAKGRFAKGLKDKKNNIVFNFSCLENPNYKHKRMMVPGLASYEWVEDKRRKWGVDDPRWSGRVLGQIPDTSVNHILGQKDIDHMIARYTLLSAYGINNGVSLDSAGEGDDDNVFLAGKNGEVVNQRIETNMAPSVQALTALEMCKEINGSFIICDCDGIGIGAWQELMKIHENYRKGIEIVKFHGCAASQFKEDDRVVYQNMRAEAAFVTQARARRGKASIDSKDEQLIEDLMEEEYFENKRGLLQIEEKDDIKERLKRSPGLGDAYKMLQWAFEQKFKPLSHFENRRLPPYAITSEGLQRDPFITRSPSHAIVD